MIAVRSPPPQNPVLFLLFLVFFLSLFLVFFLSLFLVFFLFLSLFSFSFFLVLVVVLIVVLVNQHTSPGRLARAGVRILT